MVVNCTGDTLCVNFFGTMIEITTSPDSITSGAHAGIGAYPGGAFEVYGESGLYITSDGTTTISSLDPLTVSASQVLISVPGYKMIQLTSSNLILSHPSGITVSNTMSTTAIKPKTDSTYDIGTSTMRYRTGYFDTVNTTSLSVSNLALTGASVSTLTISNKLNVAEIDGGGFAKRVYSFIISINNMNIGGYTMFGQVLAPVIIDSSNTFSGLSGNSGTHTSFTKSNLAEILYYSGYNSVSYSCICNCYDSTHNTFMLAFWAPTTKTLSVKLGDWWNNYERTLSISASTLYVANAYPIYDFINGR